MEFHATWKYVLGLVIAVMPGLAGISQTETGFRILDTLTTEYSNSIWYISQNDTLAKATFSPVHITAIATNRSKKKKYDRFQQKVVKVYPYARAAGDIMQMYDALITPETSEKQRAELLDRAEEELKAQFEKDLRKLTISEGMLLIKLIDRETGKTSFSLIRELKGKLSAFMWQSVARLFGHNLKDEYNPEGEDIWIETIVLQIEDGSIPVERKAVDPFVVKSFASSR
jgi:hypothetical protein